MGRQVGPPISEADKAWLRAQKVFFHASAPLDKDNRVNVSPKSAKEFRVVDDTTVCWLDLSGSGSETAAHIMENGRLTLLFVSFTGAPRIMRLYGKGSFLRPLELLKDSNKKYADLYPGELVGGKNFNVGLRCVVILKVTRISQSCGYSIPKFDFAEDREILNEFSEKKGYEGMIEYRGYKNSFSIDGLRSIGQLEMQQTPASVRSEGGYYFASYKSAGFVRDLLNKVSISVKMHVASGMHGWVRDMSMMCLGILLGVCSTLILMSLKKEY